MNKIREHIYLAALLHDIGKFYQRADTGSVSSSIYLSEQNKNEETFCPNYKGRYTHKHVLWTAQFLDDFTSVLKRLITDDKINDLSQNDNLINLAACHHLAFSQLSDLGKIIKEADHLSSGMDRDSDDAMKDMQDESLQNWDSFKKKRMVSILEGIYRDATNVHNYHLPIDSISLTKKYFAKEKFNDSPDYKKLWEGFVTEFKFIQANTYHAFSETLLNLMYKYTTCIPASTINFSDVSLYDHAKTTAALAICLYDYQQAKETDSASPFLLIGADFSGIQGYIYQIVSQYAGKNLKGRSFYLKLLSDSIVRYLLKELELFQSNIIYNSGGSFYILAPNIKSVQVKLQKAISEIEQQLFNAHGTSLYVAIDSIPLTRDALTHKNGQSIGKVWGELFEKRDKKKTTRFTSLINENYDLFFTPGMQGGDTKRDVITGEEFLKGENPSKETNLFVKELTGKQIKLGEVLRDTEFMVVADGGIPYWKDKFSINPSNLDFYYYFLNEKDLEKSSEQLKGSADKVSVITLNGKNGNCDFMRTIDGINNIYALEFYGGNESPKTEKGDILTYDKMCDNEYFERLGVLRMDVDNLGQIFQTGIQLERSTLSRYAALSRSFDYFFSGYLNTIWREIASDKSFIVYSGGDDIFIVGSWDTTIGLAERIHNDFREFTCNNPAFSISGGIAIISTTYPIMKGADESANEESNAKSHDCKNVDKKNSISFMGMPLNWDNEYPAVKKLKDEIVCLIESKDLARSFISKVIAHWSTANINKHQIKNFKTFWMITYDLGRMKERSKEATKLFINQCINDICNSADTKLNGEKIKTDYHSLELWAFAARWAELDLRSNKNK